MRNLRPLIWSKVLPKLYCQVTWLHEEHGTVIVILFVGIVFPHQDVDVLFREINCPLSCKIYELNVFCPVVLCIGVPVDCELSDSQHREAFLLLDLIIYIEESLLVSIICHRV